MSPQMSLNGKDVAADVSKSGDIVTISYTGGLAAEANTAILSFKESNGVERSAEWSFEVYEAGAAPAGIVWTGANGTDIFAGRRPDRAGTAGVFRSALIATNPGAAATVSHR